MELDPIELVGSRQTADRFGVGVYKHTDTFENLWYGPTNAQRCFRRNVPFAFGEKIKADGIGAGFGDHASIFGTGNSANLDPEHGRIVGARLLQRKETPEPKRGD